MEDSEFGWDDAPSPVADAEPAGTPAEDEVPPAPVIAGFWRRSFAFIVDSAVLGLAGLLLGSALFDTFAHMGPFARLVGLAIAVAYFGVLDSRLGGGQSLGKKLWKIRVVDRAGESISVARSCVRCGVFALPLFLNNLTIPTSASVTWIGALIGFVLFGLSGASAYLFVFNRRTRQSVHDLATGTFVARASTPGEIEAVLWPPHLIAVSAWLVIALGFTVVGSTIAAQGPFPAILRVVRSLEASGDYHSSSVFVGKAWGDGTETTYITASVVVKRSPADPRREMERVAHTVIDAYPEARSLDFVQVRLVYGFDIGIASAWRSTTEERPLAEW